MRVGEIDLLVETTVVAGTEPTSKVGDAVEQVSKAFDRAQAAILEVATSTARLLKTAGERAGRPERMEVEFGLKFSAQGNVIVAGAAGEATLKVTLVYESGTGAGAASTR